MKKLLYILAFLPVVGFGQDDIPIIYNGNPIIYLGGIVVHDIDPTNFVTRMTDSYLGINSHFSTYYQDEITDYLSEILSPIYDMPNGSDNYYTIFGPQGQGKDTADWFHYISFYDSLSQPTLSIPKTGDVMKWQLEDSIYIQNDIPEHQITGNGKGLLTSTDGFTGVNGVVYMGANSFTGEFPNVDFDYTTLFLDTNSYFGTVPNIRNSGHQRISLANNLFTGIEGVSNMLNSSFQQYIASNNRFTEGALETLFVDFYDYWVTQAIAPSQNVVIDVSGGSSEVPNSTTKSYITDIESEFSGSGFTITITTNELPSEIITADSDEVTADSDVVDGSGYVNI